MYQRQECWNETSSWELETGDRFPSRCFRVSSLDCLICRVWTQQTGTLTILRSLWQPDDCFYLMLVFSELHLQGLIMRSFSVKVCSAYWVSTVQLSEMSHDWLCSIAGNPINAFSALHCGKLALSLFHHCTFCFCSTVNVNCEYLQIVCGTICNCASIVVQVWLHCFPSDLAECEVVIVDFLQNYKSFYRWCY